jgi:3-hydroxybutyryl-CoA dehydrogenase
MVARPNIAALGAGRMGRGIAIVFAYAGHEVSLIDIKPREEAALDDYAKNAMGEITSTLAMLAKIGMMAADQVELIAARIRFCGHDAAPDALASADFVFEGVPETLEAKQQALGFASKYMRPDAILASTTSTILSDTLQEFVSYPERFLNAHWLNPAYLVPLVEISPGADTDDAVVQKLKSMLEAIGKVPIVCKASPGYIVPRIQALAMNEAARLVEEGVASAEDIDKATKYGFGFRFAILGLLEFIDYGGGDILYYASRYMVDAFDDERFAAPQIVEDNMKDGRIGLTAGEGFLDYKNMDIDAYRLERQRQFVGMLKHMGMLRGPVE